MGIKTLAAVRYLPHVQHVDDEREQGNGIIITLAEGWSFKADPGCGVRGFDTVPEVIAGTDMGEVAPPAVHSS